MNNDNELTIVTMLLASTALLHLTPHSKEFKDEQIARIKDLHLAKNLETALVRNILKIDEMETK